MKAYQYPVNVGSTKSHDRKNPNRMISPKDNNVILSVMKCATQNKCNSLAIGLCGTLFGLNNR